MMFARATLFRGPMSWLIAICVIASSLAGCIVPEAAPLLGHERKKRIFYDVIRGVQCEIRTAIRKQIALDRNGRWGGRKLAWLETWNALIDLNLTINDTLEFNPGVSLITPNWLNAHVALADGTIRTASQSYNFGVGGGFSYNPSRLDKVQFAYPFHPFVDEQELTENDQADGPCYIIGGVMIQGNLNIGDWLDDVLEPVKKCAFLGRPLSGSEDTQIPMLDVSEVQQSPKCYKLDFRTTRIGDPITTISHDITFALTFDANATPAWNLVRISTTSTKLFDFSRKDTSELLITFGPSKGSNALAEPAASRKGKQGEVAGLSQEMLLTHQALEIRAGSAQ